MIRITQQSYKRQAWTWGPFDSSEMKHVETVVVTTLWIVFLPVWKSTRIVTQPL